MRLNGERIHDRAMGKWRSILPALGIHERYLSGKHGPCPICDGGKDRWRYDDRAGRGTWICNQCGSGNGVDLVMRVKGLQFIEAVKLIEEQLPSAKVDLGTRRRERGSAERDVALWRSGEPLAGRDPASWYLARRGLSYEGVEGLRYLPKVTYRHTDGRRTEHPAMAALMTGPDGQSHTVHYTYLDRVGRKAAVDPVKKLAAAPVPRGGAVRLFPAAETMGIAEGIETALAAAQMFEVPVWAALSAGVLTNWEPPEGVTAVIVFSDSDGNWKGQSSATALAHRLSLKKYHVDVKWPHMPQMVFDDDWNDVLLTEMEVGLTKQPDLYQRI